MANKVIDSVPFNQRKQYVRRITQARQKSKGRLTVPRATITVVDKKTQKAAKRIFEEIFDKTEIKRKYGRDGVNEMEKKLRLQVSPSTMKMQNLYENKSFECQI